MISVLGTLGPAAPVPELRKEAGGGLMEAGPHVGVSRRFAARPWGKTIRAYWQLTKGLQTALLLATAICSYLIAQRGAANPAELALGAVSLALAISGCTALNMVFDRDLDARMARTRARPLPSGRLTLRQALWFGTILTASGLALALAADPLFAALIAVGLVFDLGVYTLWLKRRTPLSIAVGGISGGIPALAGRALALGRVDTVGLLLAAAVLLWMPSHILTLTGRCTADYQAAGIPTWPSRFGPRSTRYFIALATLLNAAALFACALLLGISEGAAAVLGGLALVLLTLAVACIIRPSDTHERVLFKAASAYMLLSFVTLTFGAIL